MHTYIHTHTLYTHNHIYIHTIQSAEEILENNDVAYKTSKSIRERERNKICIIIIVFQAGFKC